jgi:hypothetical protein
VERQKNPNAVALGSIKTEKKTRSSRENAKKAGRKPLPIDTIECTCGRGAAPVEQHPMVCKRRRALYAREYRARQKAAQAKQQPTE